LQGYGYISYRRGHIKVLDRIGLQQDVCECYAVVKKEFARLLSDVKQRQNLPAPGSNLTTGSHVTTGITSGQHPPPAMPPSSSRY
jgi:hypothetical protein